MNFRFLLAFAAGMVISGSVMAQESTSNKNQTPVQQASASAKKIGFRLTGWKTIHSQSEAAAKQDVEALQKLGCEVTTANHGDHQDVRYRCEKWKTMEVTNDQLVSQWSSWLADKGIETVVVNPRPDQATHAVKFRLPAPRTFHLHDAQKADDIIQTMRMVGVEVTTSNHGDHLDATLRCDQWQTISLPNCDKAHGWQDWLKKHGFETQHSH
jgi:hypothetical protein